VVKQPKNETVEERRARLAKALKEHLAKVMAHRQEAEENERRIKLLLQGDRKGGRSRSVIPGRFKTSSVLSK
jgi:hypothetical protein